MNRLAKQAERAGAAAVRQTRTRVVAALRDELGDAVDETDAGVVISGRRTVARIWADPGLRWIAGLLK